MAQFIKANNQTALNTNGSYTTAGVPGSSDDILFNSTFAGLTSVSLGGGFNINKLIVTNPANNFSIGTVSANLGIGAGGVDMSAATKDVTFAIPANVAINSATGGITIASGRTFAATGIISFGNGLRQYGLGNLNIQSPVGSQVIGDIYTEGILRVGLGTDSRIYTTTDRIFTGNMRLTGSTAVLTYEGTGIQTITGVISGEGYVQKYSTGTLQLNGANTFLGNLLVVAGSMSTTTAASGNASGIGFLTSSRTVDIKTGTTFTFSNVDYPTLPQGTTDATKIPTFIISGSLYNSSGFAALGNVTLNNGYLQHDRPQSYVTPGFTLIGTVTSYGSSLITGSTRNDGQVSLKPNSSTIFDVKHGSLYVYQALVDSQHSVTGFSGSSGLIKEGIGSMGIYVQSTYTGGTTINNGRITVVAGDNVPAIKGPVTINNGAALRVSDFNGLGYGAAGTGPSSITINSGSLLINKTITLIAPITLGEGALISNYNNYLFIWLYGNASINATGNSTITEKLFLMQNVPISVSANKTLTISGTIGDSGSPSLGVTNIIKNGIGMLRLTTNNTFTGNMYLNAGDAYVSCSGGATGGTGLANTIHVTPSGSESSSSLTLDGFVSFGWGRDKTLYMNALSSSAATAIPTLYVSGSLQEVNPTLYMYGSGSTKYAKITGSMTEAMYMEGNSTIVSGGTGHIIEVNSLRPWGTSQAFDVKDNSQLTIASNIESHPNTGVTSKFVKNGNGVVTLSKSSMLRNGIFVNSGTMEISSSGYLCSPDVAVQTNLIQNGDFELNTLGSEYANITTVTINNWSLGGGNFIITRLNNNGSAPTWGVPTNGSSAYAAGLQGGSSAYQTINFTRTGTYILKWQANGRGGVQVNPYYVTLDGADIGNLRSWDAANGNTWKVYQQQIVVGTTGNHTVGFRGTAATDLTVFFDNVSLAYAEHTQELAINGTSVFAYRSSTDQVLSGPITGNGTLKKYNASTLTLTKTNNAGITIESIEGTINIVPSAKITTNTFKLNGGNLQLGDI
jgi:fibronectin-binding autotransporter adhesin